MLHLLGWGSTMGTGSRALALLLLSSLLFAAPAAALAEDALEIRPRIANGLPSTAWPEVGALLTEVGTCTVTLVGCRTLLTAAHCVCSPEGLGASCGSGEFAERPEDVVVFLPQGGVLGVEAIRTAPGFQFGVAGDVALLELFAPVRGIRPRAINETQRPPFGTTGTILGFGATREGVNDAGLLRAGLVSTSSCAVVGVPNSTHVCWTFSAPVGPAGSDSNTCAGDSGGPLLADLGAGLTVVGVHSGGSLSNCETPPAPSFDADVFVERAWIRSRVGVDLDEVTCGDGPQAGDAGVTTLAFSGNASSTQTFHDFTIPPGVRLLRVSLNGIDAADTDLDLYARQGTRPSTTAFDCASTFLGSYESCEIPDPAPGSGHVLVRRVVGGTRAYQVRVTMLPEDPPPPPLTAGGVLVAGFSSFDLVQIGATDGRRSMVSSALRGGGSAFAGPEGLALDIDGSVLVANAFARNLLRVDRATGARTVVSGCEDAACTSTRGGGPPFLSPRFVARWPDGGWVVADRSVPGVYALVIVDPVTGNRGVLSGCVDAACTAVIGGGPPIGRLFGLAVEPGGTVAVADGQAVVRVNLATGDRAIVSGCTDAACSGVIGDGPTFGEPVDLVVEPDGALLVSYRREGAAFGAIRRVDPVTGARTLVSGCQDTACNMVRGAGPVFVDLFGLATGPAGVLYASDSILDAVLRIDLASGDRTLVSGCGDATCSAAAGAGPRLGEPVDLVAVPEPAAGLGGFGALGALVALRRAAPGRRG
jgi:hypothetical protein